MTTPQLLFSDNAGTTLAAPISNTATALSVLGGTGSLFPVTGTNQAFIFTLVKNGTPSVYEVCLCTSRSGDTFSTIIRNYEGTQGALAWNAGDFVNLYPTAGGLNSMLQPVTAQAEQYNYASDVGSANAYLVTLTPASGVIYPGQRFRFIAAHTNTGSSTLNGEPLVLPNGSQLPAGAIVSGGYYEAAWNNGITSFNLVNPSTAVTQSGTDNSTNFASTAFVKNAISSFATVTAVTGGWNIGAFQVRYGSFNNPGSIQTATFGTAFSNACTEIMLTIRGSIAVEFWCHSPVGGTPSSPTTTQFSHYANGNTQIDYIAIGY